ncbi:hypothetical protein Pyrfu_0991 [Pyrolobus fumarii 1A]|uniref:6-pyruvoyltetrahydropterin synthase n=1 Tax=Pyrolobus fumarii (strain DSM 11204 / 1A) TaxID=694429 RepID=G0EEN7_PYRF1|nr:6-carboxytetrahydropterin synthase [Pyrolobus fumarii]AEM38859.1 hypothetical protein Pyrfu_0991 [Pyrolobus fumarii 1A]
MKVGVANLVFEAIHYTPEPGSTPILHGHTFRVDAEVEGTLDEHGMVVDFRLLRDTLQTILSEWNMAVILPASGHFEAHGVFNYRVKRIPYNSATTEHIALTLARELHEALCRRLGAERCRELKVRLRVWESVDRYAEVEIETK